MAHRARVVSGAWLGATLGATTGLVLAALYALPFVLIFLFPPLVLIAGMVAVQNGIAPGTLIGLLFGALIGAVLGARPAPLAPPLAQRLSAGLGAALAVIVNVACLIIDPQTGLFSNWVLFISLPSILFVLAAWWMAGQLARQLADSAYQAAWPANVRWPLKDNVMLGMAFLILLAGIAAAVLEGQAVQGTLQSLWLVQPFVAALALVVLYVRQRTQISSQSQP